MKRAKGLLFLTALLMSVSLFENTKVSHAEATSLAVSNATWEHVKTAGDNPYTLEQDTITSRGNDAMRANFYVSNDYHAIGEYSISCKIQGTQGFPTPKEVQAGIVPWYVDDNNYIIAYMDWSDKERNTEMREIQITGRINGKNMVVWKDGEFKQGEWNDIWTNGTTIAPSEEITFKVNRTLADDRDAYIYRCYINGTEIGFYAFRDNIQSAFETAKIGVYGYGDTFTFNDFTYTSLNNTTDYLYLKDGVSMRYENEEGWTNEGNNYRLDALNATTLNYNQIVLRNPIGAEKYAFSANVNLEETKDTSTVSVIAWHYDEYNYLRANIQKDNNATSLTFEGKTTTLNGVQMVENSIYEEHALTTALDNITSFSLAKQGTTFTIKINDSESYSYTNASLLKSASYGIALKGVKATFNDLTVNEIPYVPFDWYSDDLGTNKKHFISAKTDENPISYSSGTYQFNENGIDLENGDNRTAFYYESGKIDEVKMSVTFQNVKQETIYGIYGWFEDSDNYLLVEASAQGFTITNHFQGEIQSETYPLPSGASFTSGSKEMSVEIQNDNVLVTWYGLKIVKAGQFYIQGHDKTKSPYIGVTVRKTPITVSGIKVTGFNSYNDIVKGDWILRGAHTYTWDYDEENNTLKGDLIGGTEWMSMMALQNNVEGKRDFYMASQVQITDSTASEYKTGFVPYYVDSNNYVFCWLSMWSGASPTIVITGRLNGKVVGSEWREAQVSYSYFDAINLVEVQIERDSVKVYLNKSFNPNFQTTIDGLNLRNIENSKVGFNLYNTSATFSDIHLMTETRNFRNTEKPTITEQGKRKEEGELNTRISLPIYFASNSAEDILDAVVKVTDPNGNEVELVKNGFTPTIVGNYQVQVTCVDNWGNEADPIEYTILVKDPNQKSSSSGCKSCAKSSTAVFTMMALISVVSIVIFKKKEF